MKTLSDLIASLPHLSSQALLEGAKELTHADRRVTARLLAHMGELDKRPILLEMGYPSLFAYCCSALGMSEDEAGRRIAAARCARRFPMLLELIADGKMHLSGICLLASVLTAENQERLLAQAAGKSKRQIEILIREEQPLPDAPATVRPLPALAPRIPPPAASPAALEPNTPLLPPSAPPSPPAPLVPPPAHRAAVTPLSHARYKIQFTMSAETCEKLRLAQDLMRHELPKGDIDVIFERALNTFVEELLKKKLAATHRPQKTPRPTKPGSRTIPAAVARAVWARDGRRCAYVSPEGRRCEATAFLQLHHLKMYAHGGEATVENVSVRCGPHNRYEAALALGAPPSLEAREPRVLYCAARAAVAVPALEPPARPPMAATPASSIRAGAGCTRGKPRRGDGKEGRLPTRLPGGSRGGGAPSARTGEPEGRGTRP
jgi:hypothetical protein